MQTPNITFFDLSQTARAALSCNAEKVELEAHQLTNFGSEAPFFEIFVHRVVRGEKKTVFSQIYADRTDEYIVTDLNERAVTWYLIEFQEQDPAGIYQDAENVLSLSGQFPDTMDALLDAREVISFWRSQAEIAYNDKPSELCRNEAHAAVSNAVAAFAHRRAMVKTYEDYTIALEEAIAEELITCLNSCRQHAHKKAEADIEAAIVYYKDARQQAPDLAVDDTAQEVYMLSVPVRIKKKGFRHFVVKIDKLKDQIDPSYASREEALTDLKNLALCLQTDNEEVPAL